MFDRVVSLALDLLTARIATERNLLLYTWLRLRKRRLERAVFGEVVR
jgi:hypothetical protein